MWYVILGAFGLGFLIGAPFCWRSFMRRRNQQKAEVTLQPELVQFKSLLTDLRGVTSSLQTTSQLLSQRAQHDHEKGQTRG